MLGRWLTGGCGCHTPGPDCAGHESDSRRRKRQEKRAVEREVQEILREREERASYLMDYGPDWRAVGRRALRIIVLYTVIACAGLLALGVRDAVTDGVVPPDMPHPATSVGHP